MAAERGKESNTCVRGKEQGNLAAKGKIYGTTEPANCENGLRATAAEDLVAVTWSSSH